MSYKSDFLNGLSAASPFYAGLIQDYAGAGLTEEEIEVKMKEYVAVLPDEVQKNIYDSVEKTKIEANAKRASSESDISLKNIDALSDLKEPSETDEVADVVKGRVNYTVGANVLSLGIWSLANGASILPFVTTSNAILGSYSIPAIRASSDIAVDVLTAEHVMVFRPMMQRYFLRRMTPLIPEAYRLAIASSKRIIDDATYFKFMAENGLNEQWAYMYKEENITYPDANTLLQLVRRGIIDRGAYEAFMGRSSYHDDTLNAIWQLKDVIPPLNDLINMAVKEAFGDHSGEAQLTELHQWANKMGLSDYFTDAYWYAHWERIPLAQMYDNLYRGYWDKDRFMAMLRIKDLHPDDREAIFNVAYQIPSVRELGYGYDVGLYDRDAIAKFRRYGGLSPEDADKAADALILYRNEAEKNSVLTEYMYLYGMGKITKDMFIAKFKEKGIPQSTIDLWVERAEAYSIRISKPTALEEGRIISSSEALWFVRNGLADDYWGREKLKALDWTDERIDIAIARVHKEIEDAKPVVKPVELSLPAVNEVLWDYENIKTDIDTLKARLKALNWSDGRIELAVTKANKELAVSSAPKALTITDYKNFYDAGMIGKDGLEEAYKSFGYSDENAHKLSVWAAVSIRLPDLTTLYKNGWVNIQFIYDRIVELGLPEERAREITYMLTKYQQSERVATEKDLTKAEIIKGWKNGVLDDAQAIGLLMDLGYSEDEAYYLLQINVVVTAGDPEGYWEMKRVTEAHKKALGQKSKNVPEDLIIMEAKYKAVKKEVEDLKVKGVSDTEFSAKIIDLANVEANYRKMMADWERL